MWRCTRTEEVHCLRIGCSAPTYKNKRGTGPPNHSPPHPFMRSWALLVAGRARRPRHHLHPGPLRHLPHPYMRRAAKPPLRLGVKVAAVRGARPAGVKVAAVRGARPVGVKVAVVRGARPVGGEGGCGARGRRQGLAGLRDRPLRAVLACGDLAGGPPPPGARRFGGRASRRVEGGRREIARRFGGRSSRRAEGGRREAARKVGGGVLRGG